MENQKIWIWAVIGVLFIGVIAYLVWPGETPVSTVEEGSEAQKATPTDQVAVEPQSTMVDTVAATGEEAEPPTPEAAAATDTQAPTPRQELASTDPSTVNLSSGDIQLIELFAFW